MSEKLSNLLDEKINQAELNDFLRDCKDDPQMIAMWQRYHVARDLAKDDISDADLKFDVAAKVMAEIATVPNEPVIDRPIESESKVVEFPSQTEQKAKKPWIPLAIAASMLLGLYVYVQQPAQQTNVENLVAESTQAEALPTDSMPHWQTKDNAIEDRLNALLVEHSEFTSATGMNGLGSYSKFVSYQKL